jgi:hypothetical protein
MVKKHRWQSVLVSVPFLLALLLLANCGSEKVAETGAGYEAKRLDARVWASTDAGQPDDLLLVNDNVWHDLFGVRMVTTDGSGQAQLRGPNCDWAFVYQNSGLKLSPCSKGGGTGDCAVGAVLSSDCDISIRTMPADVHKVGTWVAVIYLEESQVTLVIVGEGAVTVTPATELEFELVDRERMEFEIFKRELGEEIPVKVENGEPRLLYTASDQRLDELRGLGELPPARQSLGMEALQPLRDTLGQLDPILNLWVEEIQKQAEQDGIPLSPAPVTLVSIVDGEPRPNVALKWESAEDGLQWFIALDPDRQMANGVPYTADIIAAILNEEGGQIKGYGGAEPVDDFTVVLYLESPNPDLLRELAQIELPG